MYKQPGQEEFLFYTLYTAAAVLSLIACCYLLFRRGNAFAPDIKSSARLRRWTAVFFGALTLSHVWYMPGVFLTSDNDIILHDLVGGLLDSMTFVPLAIIVMLCMLQDRRRPLWPAWVMTAPLAVGMALCITKQSYDPLPLVLGYLLLLGIGLMMYMIRAIRQYDCWLRDNYADLEHKEIWHSFIVLAIILSAFTVNEFCDKAPVYEYAMLVVTATLICYLLWRVETLSDLSIQKVSGPDSFKTSQPKDLTSLLQRHCIDTRLYLQYDLNITQLATAIGTNRFYLSQYFSSLGITYNTYINDLRINYFIRLYRKAVAEGRSFTAQQLAGESGYRSYSTFRLAFQQRMGQNVRAWMNDMAQNSQD